VAVRVARERNILRGGYSCLPMALKILRWTIVTILVAILAAVAALMVLAALTGSGVDIPWA
jgi:hypothetical protein